MCSAAACTARHITMSRSLASRVPWRHCHSAVGRASSSSTRASSSSSSAKSPLSPSSSAKSETKTLYLIRHGRTEMNEYLDRNRWDDAKFVDPMMFDTRLTERGEDQARQLVEITSKLNSIPELLVASPLHRAMRTADLAFSSASFDGVPRVTCVHARERVFHASDIGRSLDAIRQDFPGWCVEEIREKHPGQDEPWWYTGETNTGDELDVETQSVKLQLGGVPSEPSEVFERRMHDLLSWLNDRPEKTIAVIAHWGVWFSLTGREFENCELVVFNLDELKPGKGKMPV